MKLYNNSNCETIVSIASKKITLMPNEVVDINCGNEFSILLKHTYTSYSLSTEEMARDSMGDDSIISVLTASHKPPYFNIVLDSKYNLMCPTDSTIIIQREKLRPTYYCSYDRLYPSIYNGKTIDISHTFKEKKQFELKYNKAKNKSNKKILSIVLTVLSILSLPLTILLFWLDVIIGLVFLIIFAIFLTMVLGGTFIISKLFNKIDNNMILSGFNSNKISEYYLSAKNNPEKYGLSID